MLFNELTVNASLLKSGIADAVSDYADTDLIELFRLDSLEVIKQDILVSLGVNNVNYDTLATNYGYLILNGLRHLQRYNIINNVLENVYQDSVADRLRTEAYKEYKSITLQFSNMKIDGSTPIVDFSIQGFKL